MAKTTVRNKYLKTMKEYVEAIQWNGQNVEEVKQFVPEEFLEFTIDRVTQIMNVIIKNPTQRKLYTSNSSDYIVKLNDNSFVIMDMFKFEETYTNFDVINKADEEAKEEAFFKIEVVKVIKAEGGYNVKDHTGFVKFVDQKTFEKQYRAVEQFFGAKND